MRFARKALALGLLWAMLWPRAGALAGVSAPDVGSLVGEPVLQLVCTPDSGQVNLVDTYRLTFRTADTIPVSGVFRITFPDGFDLSSAVAFYSDIPRPDVPGVAAQFSYFQTHWVYLDSTGTPAPAGTTLRLTLTNVLSPPTAGDFSVALEVLDANGSTQYGPSLSAAFQLTPGAPFELELASAAADTLAAGEIHPYDTQAKDQFGNLVPQVPLVYRVEPASLGTFAGNLFSALRPGTGRVIVTYLSLADTSGSLRVIPGPLASWEFSGVPSTVTAGAPASVSPLSVTARDAFGNRQFLYTDSVYFTTGDAQASLPATFSAPYMLKPLDSGRVSFPGSSFVWRTSGTDSLRVQGGGLHQATLLSVTPALAVNFQLIAPDTVVAGVPFALAVVNLKDRFGNATTGLVTLFTSSADSLAPNGQVPSLPSVSVLAGVGSTQAALYRAGGYPVFGRLGDTARNTANITIKPQVVKTFAWTVSSPVVAGVPVDSPFTLAAQDAYRNRVIQYAQVGASVALSALSGDSVTPRVLQPAWFSSGEVDLHARGLRYFGSGGTFQLVATAGQASGTSPPIEAQALFAESLAVDQAAVKRGADTLTGSIRLRVLGSGSVTITGFELASTQGVFPLSDLIPILPAYLNGPTSISFDFRWPVPGGLSEGALKLTARAFAQFPAGSVVDTCPDSASVTILRGSSPALSSLSPGTVAYADARYLASLTNPGAVGFSFHLDSSFVVFASGVRRDTARAEQSGSAFLGPGDTLRLDYRVRHASPFPGNTALAQWLARGTELGHPVSYALNAPSSLTFVAPAGLSYLAGSLVPDTLVVGQADTVRLRIHHSGGVAVTGTSAQLVLSGQTDTIRVAVTRSLTPFASWLPGDTTLAFSLSQSAVQVPSGAYRLRILVTGQQNRIDTAFTTAPADSIIVADLPSLRIDSMRVVAPNQPRVSTGQNFTISAVVENTGFDVLDSVRVLLVSDSGVSITSDTLNVGTVVIGATKTVAWNVRADTIPKPLVSFRVDLVRAVGRVTHQSASLLPSQQNSAGVQIQESANLEVQARLFSPADALDGRITAGSPFEVAGRFTNLGEAATSGAELTLRTTGGVLIMGPADTISRAPDVDAIWSLTAPNADTTAQIIVRLTDQPQDLNTGNDALVKASADTLTVRIVFEAPPLRVSNVQTSGGAVDGPYEPLGWTWSNSDPTGLFPILVKSLEIEVTDGDGATQLNAATLVEHAELELASDTIPAVITGGTLHFGTDSLTRVAPGAQDSVHVRIWPRLSGSLTEFRLATRSTNWQVVERSVNGAGLQVPVLDERGASLDIVSDLAFIPGSEVANYPNPFKAGSEATHIAYQLSSPSQVTIAVFAVSGEEVWSHQASSGGVGGQAGPNTVDWDGRNGRGDVVVDGVYFARVKASGVEATIKIVVMK